jgi:hypothetical protein
VHYEEVFQQADDDTWTYNGVDWVQQQPVTVPPTRTDNGLAYDPVLKRVVLFGGLAGACGQGRLNDTWLWDGSNWSAVQTPRELQAHFGGILYLRRIHKFDATIRRLGI